MVVVGREATNPGPGAKKSASPGCQCSVPNAADVQLAPHVSHHTLLRFTLAFTLALTAVMLFVQDHAKDATQPKKVQPRNRLTIKIAAELL
jgi:hypothetical protein